MFVMNLSNLECEDKGRILKTAAPWKSGPDLTAFHTVDERKLGERYVPSTRLKEESVRDKI